LTCFGALGIVLFLGGALAGIRPTLQAVSGQHVHSVGAAILAALLMILSAFSVGLGLLLNSINLRLLEVEKLVNRRSLR
jgi:hypothetical protein